MYHLVLVESGLIADFQKVKRKKDAIEHAESIWRTCNPESDDLKVFDKRGFITWMPPKD